MDAPITAVWPGRPYPRGATWDGEGVNFSLFSQHGEKVELCLFEAKGRREVQRIALTERTDQVWHCYLPGSAAGTPLRLSRLRTVQARAGPPLQSQQAPARSLREMDRGDAQLERRALRLPRRARARGPVVRPPRFRARHAEVPRDRSRFHLGRRPQAERSVARNGDLRAARQRLYDAAPGRAAEAARHLRRASRRRRSSSTCSASA